MCELLVLRGLYRHRPGSVDPKVSPIYEWIVRADTKSYWCRTKIERETKRITLSCQCHFVIDPSPFGSGSVWRRVSGQYGGDPSTISIVDFLPLVDPHETPQLQFRCLSPNWSFVKGFNDLCVLRITSTKLGTRNRIITGQFTIIWKQRVVHQMYYPWTNSFMKVRRIKYPLK